jgi:hypothetical protein
MTDEPIDEEMPAEIDFGTAVRGHHYIPAEAAVFLPELFADVLRRHIEINEALK